MQISSPSQFVQYYSKVKARTRMVFDHIPPDKIEWRYRDGKFSIGDLIRHLANIELHMYAENAQFKPSRYAGCGLEYAEGYDAVVKYYDDSWQASKAIFLGLSEADLVRKTTTPAGIDITLWKWLRAMVEHEIHHRGQIYLYLGLINVPAPPIFGLTSEEVADRKA